MQPLISVIIPVFNTKKYISECLESIIFQNLKEIEIICVNDGSTDGSRDELEKYSKIDSRIIILHQKNAGVAAARNLALKYAHGKYLFFVDSDDFIVPDILKEFYNKAENINIDFLISKQKIFSDLNREEFVIRGYEEDFLPKNGNVIFSAKEISNVLFQIFSSELHGKIFRTNFIKENKLSFPEASIGEDYYFFYLAMMLSDRIAVWDQITYNYRRLRNDSLTMQSNNTLDFYKSLMALQSKMEHHKIYNVFKNSYEEYIIKQIFLNAKRATRYHQKQIFKILEQKYPYLLLKENVCKLTPLDELKQLYKAD